MTGLVPYISGSLIRVSATMTIAAQMVDQHLDGSAAVDANHTGMLAFAAPDGYALEPLNGFLSPVPESSTQSYLFIGVLGIWFASGGIRHVGRRCGSEAEGNWVLGYSHVARRCAKRRYTNAYA